MIPKKGISGDAVQTIYARATGQGVAAVAIYRISGPGAAAVLDAMTTRRRPAPRTAALRRFVDPETGHTLDEGLAILFPGPDSFTGEDVVEFQLHGGPAIEKDLYRCLSRLAARPAAPGEFTRRALMNGRLDLAQVEGLADLLVAETSMQREQALGQYGGKLSARADGWRRSLVEAMAQFEASIDFADEADAPATAAAARTPLTALLTELRASAAGAVGAEAVREGFRIAIIGAPNAGKSSLLNRLAGDERAIVSDVPGTTRDVIEARLDIGGRLVSVFDTAGLRTAASDAIELEGMRRSQAAANKAHLRLILIDPFADVSRGTSPVTSDGLVPRETSALMRAGDLVVLTKTDLGAAAPGRVADPLVGEALRLSAKTGAGVDELIDEVARRLDEQAGAFDEGALTRQRHIHAVETAIAAVERSLTRIDDAPELAAEDLRLAARYLGRIVGAVDVEDVLGEIFASFCIGK